MLKIVDGKNDFVPICTCKKLSWKIKRLFSSDTKILRDKDR